MGHGQPRRNSTYSEAMSVFLAKFLSCSGEVLEIFGYAHLSYWIAGRSEQASLSLLPPQRPAQRPGGAILLRAFPPRPAPVKAKEALAEEQNTPPRARAGGGI